MRTCVLESLEDALSAAYESGIDSVKIAAIFQEVSEQYELCFDLEVCNEQLQYAVCQSIPDAIDIFQGTPFVCFRDSLPEILTQSLTRVSCVCLCVYPTAESLTHELLAKVTDIVWPERWLQWLHSMVC
jgi:hypothetical protein